MKIEIDLAKLGFHYDEDGDPVGNRTIEDAIVQSAAGLIVSQTKRDLRKEILKAVSEQVNELVKAEVAAVIAQPIQPTSPWGEAQGGVTTIREMVRARLEGYLKDPPRRRDGYSNTQATVGTLSELIDQEVVTLMTKEMKVFIAEAKKQVVTDLRDKALKAAAEALMPR